VSEEMREIAGIEPQLPVDQRAGLPVGKTGKAGKICGTSTERLRRRKMKFGASAAGRSPANLR